MDDVGTRFPPPVLEPGPRTAQQHSTFLVVLSIVLAAVAIGGTFAIMVYLLASGRA